MFFRRPPHEQPTGPQLVETPAYTVVTITGPEVWLRMRDVELRMAKRLRPPPRSERPPVTKVVDNYTMEWAGDERGPLLEICAELSRIYPIACSVEIGGTFVVGGSPDPDADDSDDDE